MVIEQINKSYFVKVIENKGAYYQLRYFARIKQIHQFKDEFEISERKFVKLNELKNYIKWYDGITFQAQLESAKKHLD